MTAEQRIYQALLKHTGKKISPDLILAIKKSINKVIATCSCSTCDYEGSYPDYCLEPRYKRTGVATCGGFECWKPKKKRKRK